MGAMTLVVPGNFPIGCSAAYLTTFIINATVEDYDPQTGCLNWLNNFAMQHNTVLQTALARIQESHPHANIIYADYYNAAMQLFLNPYKFGEPPALIFLTMVMLKPLPLGDFRK